MFTIDLLKGQCRPIRTRPQGMAIFVATFAVPVLVTILMIGYYIRNSVIISVQSQNIATIESKIKRLADDINFKEACEKEKSNLNSCLAEVSGNIDRHVQWSPILETLVENLPDSVILTNLEVRQQTMKQKVALKGDTSKKVNTVIPVRTLKMRVCGNTNYDYDLDIRKFRDRLRASKIMGPRLEDVIIASQGHDVVNGHDVVAYDIDCVFKPGL